MSRLEITPSRGLAIAVFVPVAFLALPVAAAETIDLQQEHRPPVGVELSLGVRGVRMGGAGFEPFSDNHALAESALAATYRLTGSPRAGVTIGAEWNHGNASSSARGSAASLDVDRLALSLRGHVSVRNRLLLFGRVAPGVIRTKARLTESSALAYNGPVTDDATLTETRWVPAVDGALGAAFRVGQLERPREHVYGLWLVAEGGYSLAVSHQVTLGATTASAPAQTAEPLRLGALTPGGAFMDVVAALTF